MPAEAQEVPVRVPVCRPLLPPSRMLVPLLERVDQTRIYTNQGPLERELNIRLGEHFEFPEGRTVLAANGTMAIIGGLLAVAGRANADRPFCVCPSYTFAATGIAAASCGYQPLLADVCEETWMLTPDAVRRLPEFDRVAAVIVVSPYGQPADIGVWQDFMADTGIPVVFDAAACFDTLDHAALADCPFPVAVSLHATKTFSTAEGGLVFTAGPEMAEAVGRALNFGFWNSRESVGPSINGKLSEYHAAVGLAELDGWIQKREAFRAVAQCYRHHATRLGLEDRIQTETGAANPYALSITRDENHTRAQQEGLRAEGIDTRLWYGGGLHRQRAFVDCRRTMLAVTDDIARRILGLPCYPDLPEAQVRRVVEIIGETFR